MNFNKAAQILYDKHSAIEDRLEAHSFLLRSNAGDAQVLIMNALADIALKLSGKKKVEDWI